MRIVLLTLCALMLLAGTAVADQLGNTTPYETGVTIDDWIIYVGMFIATEDGTADSLCGHQAEVGDPNGRMALYEYVYGTLTLVDSTAETQILGIPAWMQWATIEGYAFSTGDTLFVGFWSESATASLLYKDNGDNDSDSAFKKSIAYEAGWPTPTSDFDFKLYEEFSAYIVYTPSGAPPASGDTPRRARLLRKGRY